MFEIAEGWTHWLESHLISSRSWPSTQESYKQRVTEYDQIVSQSHTTDPPMTPRGRNREHRRPHDSKN